jgi:hypothetical protein
MDYPLNTEQYSIIYKVSFLSLGSSIYAMYNGYYGMSIYPGGVFLTSVNYWRKPDYSWRRYLDMGYVKYALTCQLYNAYGAQYGREYCAVTFIAVCFYVLGVYYNKKSLYWHSTYAHCMLHIIANIANLILYSGKITYHENEK